MDQQQLTRDFNALPQSEKDNFQLMADMNLEQARGLEDELKELMNKRQWCFLPHPFQAT